jgi:hypothetical protein
MPAPNNPNVCRVAMLFARDTRTHINTFHVVKATPWTPSDLPALATSFSNWWSSQYKFQCDDAECLYQVQCRVYNPANPYAYDLNVSPNVCGTLTGTSAAPSNSTVSVSWRTGLAGRKYRGRFYTVGMNEAQAGEDDKAVSSYVTGMSAAAAQLLSTILAAGLSLALFHRIDDTFTAITSTVVESVLDSQRRRLPGRGR